MSEVAQDEVTVRSHTIASPHSRELSETSTAMPTQVGEALYRSAFEQAAIGMALVGLNGAWLRVNRGLCRIVGYSEQELLATDFQHITHPDDLGPDLNYAAQITRGEIRSYQMEKR